MTSFGIYIHIPYCLQLCSYCDFAKYEVGTIPNQDHYTQLLIQEIRQKEKNVPKHGVTSIYFGGGTPSLMTPRQLDSVIVELKKHFQFKTGLEITIEINPGTLTPKSLEEFLSIGINRFSVGAQTFDNALLKKVGRKHSAKETVDTLSLLNQYQINFSMDLLFALPTQSFEQLKHDLEIIKSFEPPHVSTYYLNVPKNHFLSQARPADEVQIEMFHTIEDFLEKNKILRYEISNFAKAGGESKHNMVYWTHAPYWGIGLGAHSYLPDTAISWGGRRFFNPRTYSSYEKNLLAQELPKENTENLEKHQALTEFCYTSLRRTRSGFSQDEVLARFGEWPRVLEREIGTLLQRGLLENTKNRFILSKEGRILSNLVFERLTFLKEDLY